MPNRVLDFVRSFIAPTTAPEPPPINNNVPGAFVYFMDENEDTVLYQKPWPYRGMPYDDSHPNPTCWLIEGKYYCPSRRDTAGNWIYRRCAG